MKLPSDHYLEHIREHHKNCMRKVLYYGLLAGLFIASVMAVLIEETLNK